LDEWIWALVCDFCLYKTSTDFHYFKAQLLPSKLWDEKNATTGSLTAAEEIQEDVWLAAEKYLRGEFKTPFPIHHNDLFPKEEVCINIVINLSLISILIDRFGSPNLASNWPTSPNSFPTTTIQTGFKSIWERCRPSLQSAFFDIY
jgi:hypothetical protein